MDPKPKPDSPVAPAPGIQPGQTPPGSDVPDTEDGGMIGEGGQTERPTPDSKDGGMIGEG